MKGQGIKSFILKWTRSTSRARPTVGLVGRGPGLVELVWVEVGGAVVGGGVVEGARWGVEGWVGSWRGGGGHHTQGSVKAWTVGRGEGMLT